MRSQATGELLARAELRRLLAILDGDGEDARLVGGAVRNALLGLEPGDIDIATTALPEEVSRRARAAGFRAVPTGIEHGTVTVVVDHHPFEVTTLREDVETDGRRARVVFGRDFAHDARRRDFTVNALYLDRQGVVHDPVGGLPDLEAGRIRFIGDPSTRIREDYLRILRLFRFHAEYGRGLIDEEAAAAAVRHRDGLDRLSAERIRAEMLKLLAAPRAAETVQDMAESGLLLHVLGGVPDVPAFKALANPGVPVLTRLAALAVRIREDSDRLQDRMRLSNADHDLLVRTASCLERLQGRTAKVSASEIRELAYRRGRDAVAAAVSVGLARAAFAPAESPAALMEAAARPVPVLPFRGAEVLARGARPGPAVGAVIAAAERRWVEAGFPADAATQSVIFEEALREALPDSTSG